MPYHSTHSIIEGTVRKRAGTVVGSHAGGGSNHTSPLALHEPITAHREIHTAPSALSSPDKTLNVRRQMSHDMHHSKPTTESSISHQLQHGGTAELLGIQPVVLSSAPEHVPRIPRRLGSTPRDIQSPVNETDTPSHQLSHHEGNAQAQPSNSRPQPPPRPMSKARDTAKPAIPTNPPPVKPRNRSGLRDSAPPIPITAPASHDMFELPVPNILHTSSYPVMIEAMHDPDDEEYAAWNRAKQMYAKQSDGSEKDKRGSRGSSGSFGESDSATRHVKEVIAAQSSHVLASPMAARCVCVCVCGININSINSLSLYINHWLSFSQACNSVSIFSRPSV